MRTALQVIAIVCALAPAIASAQSDAVDGFVARARDAQIVVLGEIHDNPEHHRIQADIVARLAPAALVLEMIPQADEDAVNALREEGAGRDEIAVALDWAGSGWPDFDYYAAILEAAPEAQIFGAGQPSEDVRRAMVEGAAKVFGADAATYGLDLPLDPEEQRAREALQAEAHCNALPADLLPGMVEAQRFRDAGLADSAIWARTMTGDGQVVVIAGSGHADTHRGIPAALAIAAPDISVLSLGQFERTPSNADSYDEVLLAPPPERDDPCEDLMPQTD